VRLDGAPTQGAITTEIRASFTFDADTASGFECSLDSAAAPAPPVCHSRSENAFEEREKPA
jgi:hypothetical protein